MDSKFSSSSTSCNLDEAFSNIETELQRKRSESSATTEKLQNLIKAYKDCIGRLQCKAEPT
jgi:hypothetical protein